MSEVIKCDKCGEIMDISEDVSVLIIRDSKKGEVRRYDLCEKCGLIVEKLL